MPGPTEDNGRKSRLDLPNYNSPRHFKFSIVTDGDSDSKQLIGTDQNQSVSLDGDDNELGFEKRLSRDQISPSPQIEIIKGETSQNSVGTISLDGDAPVGDSPTKGPGALIKIEPIMLSRANSNVSISEQSNHVFVERKNDTPPPSLGRVV